MEIAIRLAGTNDFAEAWAIVNEYYDAVGVVARDDETAFRQSYFGAGSGVWLARVDGVAAGCIALRGLESLTAAGEVKRLYVQPQARGLGIAVRLLRALEDYSRLAGYRWLYLDSKDDLTDAIDFYHRHGYVDCGRYNDNPQATIFMKKELADGEG